MPEEAEVGDPLTTSPSDRRAALASSLLLAVKVAVPRARPRLVSRPRLTLRLRVGLAGRLTLLAAPARFGKTTLLADWLGDAGHPAAWFALDDGDNDPRTFARYLVAAPRTLAPDVGGAALALLEAPHLPAPEMLATALLNDLARAFTGTSARPAFWCSTTIRSSRRRRFSGWSPP